MGCFPDTYSATLVEATITSVNIVEIPADTLSPIPTLMNTQTPTAAPISQLFFLDPCFRHTCMICLENHARRKCCEEGALPDEAISLNMLRIASGKEQERPRNDGIVSLHPLPSKLRFIQLTIPSTVINGGFLKSVFFNAKPLHLRRTAFVAVQVRRKDLSIYLCDSAPLR